MRILSLSLEQFRNYSLERVEMGTRDIQLFLGENGHGKTNIIEAVSLLSITRSCRGKDDKDMVQWEKGFYRIKADVQKDDGTEHVLEVVAEVVPRKRKGLFINDVKLSVGEMVGFLPTVTFLPQDLTLFSGPPAERRRFLDQLLSQLSPGYLRDLSQYLKVMQQRNALLKKIGAGDMLESGLDLWDKELACAGSRITAARLELIETLNMSFAEELARLGEDWAGAVLAYERKSNARSTEELEAELVSLLLSQRRRDIILQSTTVGPHREDWQVVQDGKALPSFASRGQERTAVLALLLLQVAYMELKKGEKPVILLDDAFSELDDAHQRAVIEGFQGYQVLMTAIRMPDDAGEVDVFQVKRGGVERGDAEGRGERGEESKETKESKEVYA